MAFRCSSVQHYQLPGDCVRIVALFPVGTRQVPLVSLRKTSSGTLASGRGDHTKGTRGDSELGATWRASRAGQSRGPTASLSIARIARPRGYGRVGVTWPRLPERRRTASSCLRARFSAARTVRPTKKARRSMTTAFTAPVVDPPLPRTGWRSCPGRQQAAMHASLDVLRSTELSGGTAPPLDPEKGKAAKVQRITTSPPQRETRGCRRGRRCEARRARRRPSRPHR